ncbi:hemagglutinin repeat-containing protein [Sinorhizobium meliloti]|uniref:hemagglutinin repeat-containing protein n=1 Tax=Rhizobium meliloti TaxID=382 RepID=UPI003DA0DFAD
MIFGDKKVIGKSSSAKWIGRIARQSLATALSALLAFQPLLARAQSVTPDAGAPLANQAGVGVAPNGVPLIDIVTPNTRGLSHNKYDRFNVDEPGLILNNYDGEVGKSLLGGVTPGNANLRNSGPAAVILNEVTSGNRSQLLGPTEIFGGRADVIVANPNGITCDGCGFINTPRAMLTTGTPDVGADGNLKSFTVRGGDVAFGKRGGNFAADPGAVDLFDIVSRAVRIDGPVHARDLRLTIGRNKVDYASGDATPLEEKTGTPEFAIDGSALGAMQADRIKVVVTEKGAGVRMRGDMAANIGELSLSASGKISIGNASGAAGVNLKSRSGIEAQKVTSRKKVVARADNGITLQSVAADEIIDLGSGTGLLSVAGDTRALGTVALSSSGGIALGDLEAQRAVSARSEAGNIEVRGSAKTQGDLTITAVSGSVFAGSLVSFRNLALRAGLDIGITGELLAQGTISAVGRSIRSNSMISGIDIVASQSAPDGTPVLGTSGGLTLSAGGAVEAGSLVSADGLDITASSLRLGDARAQGKVSISGDVSANGQILGGGDVAIAGRIIAADTIASGVDFRASSSGSDIILGKTGSLNLRAGTGTVDVRQLSSAGLLFAAASELVSEGLTALGAIDLRGNVSVDGQVLGAGDVAVSGNKIAVDTLVSGVDFARTAKGTRIEVAGRGDILLDAAAGELRAGMLISAGSLKATAGRIAAADLNSSRDMELVADVAVSGKIAGAGNVRIEGSSITAATIAAGAASIAGQEGELSLVARGGTIKVDVLESAGRMVLDTARLDAKSIAGRGDVDIATGAGTGGQVFAGGTLRLSGGSLAIETLIAGLDFARTDASGRAVLARDGDIVIDAASGTISASTLLAAGGMTATVGKLVAENVNVHGNVRLFGDADIRNEILAAGNVAIAGKTIKSGTIASGVDFAATEAAGGELTFGRTGTVTLTARGGTVTADAIISAGRVAAETSKLSARSITGYGDIRLVGDVDVRERLLGAGRIDLSGGRVTVDTVVSGVDFSRMRAGNGDIVLGEDGALTIDAPSGNVTASTLLSAGDLVVSAQKIAAADITGRKNIRLAGAIEAKQILGGRDIGISGGRTKAGSIASGVNFAATEAGGGTIALSDRGDLSINAASQSVETGAILTAGSFSSNSGTLAAGSVNARGAVSIDGSATIEGSMLAGGNVSIRGGSISADAIVSGVDFSGTNGNAAADIALGSGGALTLAATSGAVTAGTLVSAGDLTLTASKIAASNITGRRDVRLFGETDANQILGARNIEVKADGDVKAGSIASGVDFAATAARGSITLSKSGNLTIIAASGDVEAGTVLSAGSFRSRSASLKAKNVTAHGAVTIDGSVVVDGSLLSRGNVTVRGGSISAGAIVSGVDFDATGSSAQGKILLGADGALTLQAASGSVTAGTLLSAGNLAVSASEIGASNVTGRKDIRLAGDIKANQILGGRDIAIAARNAGIGSIASGVDFSATQAGDGSIALSDGGNLTVDAASGDVEAGTILTAGNFSSASKNLAAKSITVHGAVSIDGSAAIEGSLLGRGPVTIRGDGISAGAIVSGVDFAATKRSATGNVVLGADGALTLAAAAGNVTSGTLLSAGDLTVAGRKVSVSTVTARKAIGLTGDDLEAGQILGGGDIALAGTRLKAGSIASGVDFAATEAGNGSIALSDRGKLTIDVKSGTVDAGTVLTAGSLGSTSARFAARSVTAYGAVSIDGSTAIDGSLLGKGDVAVRGASISAGAIVAGVDFGATGKSASGNVVLGGDATLTLTATSGNVTAAALLSAGDLSATASKVAVENVTGRGNIRLAGEIETNQLLGGGDVTVAGSRIKAISVASGVDFAATEAGNGSIVLSARGDLTIDAGSGSVDAGAVLTAGALSSRSATFAAKSITANDAVSIDGSAAVDGALLSQGNVAIRGGSVSAGAIVSGADFAATKRSASGKVLLGAAGVLTLTATSGNVTAGALLSAGDVAATASKIAVANITGRRNISLSGEAEIDQILSGGDIRIAGSRVKAASIASGVDFAATDAGNGSIVLSAGGDLKIDARSGSVEAGTVLTAGLLSSRSGTFAARSVTAYGAVTIDGSAAIEGSLLGEGDVTIRGGSVTAGAIVSGVDFAATKRSASGNVVLGSGGGLTLTATSGNVTAGTLLTGGDLAVTAANDVFARATSRRKLTIDAGGSIRLAGQTLAGTDMSLRADRVTVDTLVSGVDFAATEASPSGALALKEAGKLKVAASSGAVTAGNLVSAGMLDVPAKSDVSYDSLQSFASARLASADGSVSTDRITRAAGDITLLARSVDLSGNRGRIATTGTLAIVADSASLAGSAYNFGGLDLSLIGNADFTGASISAVRRSGGSGDIRIAASAIDADTATALLAERDVALTLSRLDNAGQVAAGRDLSVSAGNLSNAATGLIYAGNDIDLFVSGEILNDEGAIMAGGDLAIAGATADRSNASLTNVSGLIQAGSDVSIKTGRLVNKRLADPTWTRDVLVESDVVSGFELNAEVASRPFAHLFYGWNDDDRWLYQDLPMQYWQDYEDDLWSEVKLADGTSWRAWTWQSSNGPRWSDNILAWIRARAPRDADGNLVIDPENPSKVFIVHYQGSKSDSSTVYTWDEASNISQTIYEDRIVDAGSPQALIRAGRDLHVSAETLTNAYSAIEADGNATLSGTELSNEGLVLNRTVETTCNALGACEAYDAEGNRDPSRDIAAGTSIVVKTETTGAEAGTVKAGGYLDISGFASVSNTAAERSVAGSAKLAPTTKPGDPLAALAGLTAGGALFTPNAALLGVAQGNGLIASGSVSAPAAAIAGERPAVAAGAALSAGGTPVAVALGLSAASERLNAAAAPVTEGARIAEAAAVVAADRPVAGGAASASGTAVAAVRTGTSAVAAPLAEATASSLKEATQVDADQLASLAAPDSGGFGGTIPGQVFLFETRASFLDVGKFYGSGYYAKQIGYEPDTRVPFLGDAYFENQLIDRQLRQATGYGLGGTFAPGKDAIAEMKLLLDNGIEYVKANKLSIGERLSPGQIARLTQSIVLYETQVVQGIEVLAPVVYLADADKARLTAAGALIAGGSVSMDIGTLGNSGAIAARTDLSIRAADIRADGGSFVAGGDVKLASTGDITFTAQSYDLGGMNVVNPNAAVVAGGNAFLIANDGLKLQGAAIDAAGSLALSADSITLDALKVDNGGSQNAAGSLVRAGSGLTIAVNTDVSIIGSAAKAGKDLLITAQGSVNLVSTDVSRTVSDGYMTTTGMRQQEGQLVSGGSTAVSAGNDILLSGSAIRSGADVVLDAAAGVNITAAREEAATSFGKNRGTSEKLRGSAIASEGSIAVTAGSEKKDGDLNIVGSKLEAKERVDLDAADDLTIAEARNRDTLDLSWRWGRTKSSSRSETETAAGSTVSGGAGVSTLSGGDTVVSASKLRAGSGNNAADLDVRAKGDIVISSGEDSYEMHERTSSRGFLRKSSSSNDLYDETTVASELGASGNVTLDGGESVAIAGSKLDAGKSVTIEGDEVAIMGAEEKQFLEVKKKKSGLFAGSGDGFISLWGKEQKESRQSSTENVASKLTAGEDVAVKARDGDVAVFGSAIDAARDIRLEAARDVNVTPGAESSASQEKEKRSGFGIAYSSGAGGASIGIGYGSRKDEVRESAETNAGPQLSAGRDATIAAGRDANLQAAKVEAERDVAIAAARDVNLLSAQDRTNYEEVHEQLFAGVTLSVSTGLVSAAESVGNAASKIGDISDGYSAANAAFASLKAYDALDDIASGNVVSGSLTVGFDYSKEKAAGEATIPVTTDIRAGRSVTIDAVSGDLTGRGPQIAAGYGADGLPIVTGDGKADEKAGDITLRAGDDVMLENATAASSASSGTKSASAGIGIGAGIGVNGVGVGLTGNAAAASGKSNGEGTTAVNARVTGRGDVTIRSGDDTVLKGAVVSAEAVTAEVGDDLTIVSVPDTGKSANSSLSGGFSLGGALGSTPSVSGISIGGGKGSGSTNWITEQSGLVSGGSMDVTVGGDTHLGAGKIISDSGELRLSTETLTHENFEGEKQYEGVSATLGLDLTGGKGTSADPVGNSTLEGGYKLDDTRQQVRATVGSGEIELRAEEKQAALERDGTSTLPLDGLNRDPDQAYEITRDKHVELEVYLSERSLNAIGTGLKEMVAPGGFVDKYLLGRELTAEETAQVRAGVEALANGGSFAGCGQKQGFNLFQWIITPAYAYETNCKIRQADGSFIELGIKSYEECQNAIYAYLNNLSVAERVKVLRSAGFASGSDASANAEAWVMNSWLLDAIEKLDGQAYGGNLKAYLEGTAEGARFVEELGSQRWAIWNDSSISFEQKAAELENAGLDVSTFIAMAILGGSTTRPSLRRLDPGVASHGGYLPRVVDGQTWLKGTAGNAGKVPAQIAEQLAGRNFKDFNEFRGAFWVAVSKDPVLRTQFTRQNQARMKNGLAPFVVDTQGVGGRQTYELDHMLDLRNGGNVYDMDNIIIRTPLNHLRGK